MSSTVACRRGARVGSVRLGVCLAPLPNARLRLGPDELVIVLFADTLRCRSPEPHRTAKTQGGPPVVVGRERLPSGRVWRGRRRVRLRAGTCPPGVPRAE